MCQPYGVYLKHPWNFTTFNWKIKSSHRSGWKPIFQAAQKAKSQQSSFAIQKLCQDQPFFWQFELQASDTNRDKQGSKRMSIFHPQPKHKAHKNGAKYFSYYVYDSHLWPDFGLINAMLFVICAVFLLLWHSHDSLPVHGRKINFFI